MEKRDIIVIVVAVFIVLIMAMYIKPLVTGKPVQLIPDELSGLFGGGNQTEEGNATQAQNATPNVTRVLPNVTKIEPVVLDASKKGTVLLVGDNFSDAMTVSFTQNNSTKTFPSSVQNGTLYIPNVSLPEGNWSIDIYENNSKVPIPTSKKISVETIITPIPTWDGKPINVGYSEKGTAEYIYPNAGPQSQYQPYSFKEKKNLTQYAEFTGQYPSTTNVFSIPQGIGYWEIQYTVNYTKNFNNPLGSETSGDFPVFQFNKERIRVIEDGVQKEILITKGDSREESEGETSQPLVESYSVVIPTFSITVVDSITNRTIREITPDGGLDPLLWDKAAHKEEKSRTSKSVGKEIEDEVLDEWVKHINDPRPWSEKFFTGGSFYLIIKPKNIKSYKIDVLVGGLIQKTEDVPVRETINPLNQTLSNYIKAYNDDYNAGTYSSNLTNFYSSRIRSEQGNQLISTLVQSRAAGVTIRSYKVFGTGIKDNGNLKGEITYQYQNSIKTMPIDLNYVADKGVWKIDTPIIIRY